MKRPINRSIPKALPAITLSALTSLVAGGLHAAGAESSYIQFTPQDIIKVEDGQTETLSANADLEEILTKAQQYSGKTEDNGKQSSIIKDGQGILTLDRDLQMTCTFEVREGTTVISNARVENYPTILSPNLMVSGTNARLELDNAHYYNSVRTAADSYISAVLVGGQDGDGTLVLKNQSSLQMAQGIFVGYDSWKQENASSVSPTGHNTGSYVSAEENAPFYADQHQGTDTFSTNPVCSAEGMRWAHGTISIEGGSTLDVGTASYIRNATINIDGAGSVYRDAARQALNGSGYAEATNIAGSNSGITTDINITNGGRFTTYEQLEINVNYTQAANTIINVVGEGSAFESRTTDNPHAEDGAIASGSYTTREAYIGYALEPVQNPTGKVSLNLKEGGSALFDVVQFGHNGARVETDIDSQSSMTAREIYMESGMKLTNEGHLKASLVSVDAAEVLNTGTITVQTLSTLGGNFTNNGTIDLQGTGTGDAILGNGDILFHVQGSDTDAALLALSSTTLNNTLKAVIDLSDPSSLIGTTTTFLTLNGEWGKGVARDAFSFSGDDTAGNLQWNDEQQSGTFTYGGGETMNFTYQTAQDGNISQITFHAIPEPATTTLGLLALASLVARRRRR